MRHLLAFFSILLSLALSGQKHDNANYSLEEGLHSSIVWSIMEAEDNTIWLATHEGVSWFDSHQFHTVPFDTHTGVNQIIQGKDNTIWVASFNGIHYYKPESGKKSFTRLQLHKQFNFNYFKSIAEDSEGRLYFGLSRGMLTYNRKTKESDFIHILKNIDEHTYSSVDEIIEDTMRDVIWIATQNEGIFSFNKSTKQIQPIGFGNICKDVKTLVLEGDSVLWAGSINTGLHRYALNRKSYQHFTKENSFLPNNSITEIKLTPEKDLLIATNDAGFIKHNLLSQKTTYLNKENAQLPNNKVLSILYDSNKYIWLGHYLEGLSFISGKKKIFSSEVYNQTSSFLKAPNVKGFLKDSEGKLWIANDAGGIVIKDSANHITHISLEKLGFIDDAVHCIYQDKDSIIWAGLNKNGAICFSENGQVIKKLSHDINRLGKLPSAQVRGFAEDKNGRMWIATHGGGLCRLDENKETADLYVDETQSERYRITSSWIENMEVGPAGNLWITTVWGIDIFDVAENKVITDHFISSFNANPRQLGYICFPNSETAIIASREKLYQYTFSTNTFKELPFSINNFNITNIIYHDSAVFIAGNNGLLRYSLTTQDYQHYKTNDGLHGNQFIKHKHDFIDDSLLYVGGTKGYTFFNPNNTSYNKTPPKILFTDFKLFDKTISPDDKNSPLQKSINHTDKLILNHKQNIFSIQFSAINYFHPSKNRYVYKLIGFDKEWQLCKDHPIATYMNLPPGEYQLHVKASNNDGIWNEEGRTLSITVLPPWWATLWFKIMLAVAAVITLWTIYILRIRSIKRQNIRLEKIVKERTKTISDMAEELSNQNELLIIKHDELESTACQLKEQSDALLQTNEDLSQANKTKNQLFSIIAHDVKNSLGPIINFSKLLIRKRYDYTDEKIGTFLSRINASGNTVYHVLENLLHWAQSQGDEIRITPETIDISDIVHQETEQQAVQLEDKNISITISITSAITVSADVVMLTTIIRNALNNAIKFTSEQGRITVSAHTENGFVILTINNSGEVMSQNIIDQIFNSDSIVSKKGTAGEQGTGLGLQVCKYFAELNNATITMKSSDGDGTSFSLSIPLSKGNLKTQPTSQKKELKTKKLASVHTETIDETQQNKENTDLTKTVLVIDDNPYSRQEIKESIYKMFTVIEAEDGADGLDKALNLLPDLILCDVNMPQKDGFTVLSELKAHDATSHIPVMMITALSSDLSKLKGYKIGAEDYITKPFNVEIIKQKIVNKFQTVEQLKNQLYNKLLKNIDPKSGDDATEERFVKKLKLIIEENIENQEFSVQMLADLTAMSRSHLFKKTKAILGITPVELITSIRMKYAKQLLEHSEHTITQVAYKTGYSSLQYFSKSFIKYYGYKPSECRKQD